MQNKELDALLGKWVMTYSPDQMASRNWRPSESMLQAWELVEALSSAGFRLEKKQGKWEAKFLEGTGLEDTPALAICVAAWRSVQATGGASTLSGR